jgi:hypothetical protein
LKAKLKETRVTYAELVKRLKKHGLKETEAGATFFLDCLAALELEGVVLEEL